MERPPPSPPSVVALETYEVFGSDDEEFGSEESRLSIFSSSSAPNAPNVDTVEEAFFERATAQSLAATDGSARGSPFSGRSVSSSSSANFDESSNPIEYPNLNRPLLSPINVPVLPDISTRLVSFTSKSHVGYSCDSALTAHYPV